MQELTGAESRLLIDAMIRQLAGVSDVQAWAADRVTMREQIVRVLIDIRGNAPIH